MLNSKKTSGIPEFPEVFTLRVLLNLTGFGCEYSTRQLLNHQLFDINKIIAFNFNKVNAFWRV